MDPYDLVLPILSTAAIALAPYTKVEESFNIQATHDLLFHGWNIQEYDHLLFPGVVPRTFIGPLALAGLSLPARFLPFTDKFSVQIIVRITLGCIVAASLSRLAHAVQHSFGGYSRRVFLLLCAAQFHIIFWGSRTLPNMFAFALVNIALAHWIDSGATQRSPRPSREERQHHLYTSFAWFTAAGALFRSEIVLLLAPIVLMELYTGRALLLPTLTYGFTTFGISVASSMLIDSVFWRSPFMWPEWQVFHFNTIQNRSSEWGTSPWHAYITQFIPRIAHVAIIPAILGVLLVKGTRRWCLPPTLFVLAYSLLPHKEWRFIVYVLPIINMAAAAGISRLIILARSTLLPRIILGMIFITWCLACATSVTMTSLSTWNYPGGEALARLHHIIPPTSSVHVHIDTASAISGASKFGERNPAWSYSKTEGLFHPSNFTHYTHLITAEPAFHSTAFKVVSTVPGLDGHTLQSVGGLLSEWASFLQNPAKTPHLSYLLPVVPRVKIAAYIMERKDIS